MEIVVLGFFALLETLDSIWIILILLSLAFVVGVINKCSSGATSSQKRNRYINMRRVDSMSGIEFEKFCAEILQLNGYSQVRSTPASGDQGVDIVAKKGDVWYAFQCKHYKTNVGNKAIQQVYTGKAYYKCNVGVVITNSHFTTKAKEIARTTHTVLWGREQLQELIKHAAKVMYP